MQTAANNTARRAAGLADGVKIGTRAGGVVLVGAGIALDMHNGEDVDQAVASNIGGAVAGMGAAAVTTGAVSAGATVLAAAGFGAAAGSAVPIVGTAIGLVVGAGVGFVVSGAIDQHWDAIENGVGDAASKGKDLLDDAGGAISKGWKKLWG